MTPDEWIRAHVEPTGAPELVNERPWATTWRVPVGEDAVFFKRCGEMQRFEPRLTAALHARWPDRVVDLLAFDEEQAWLLTRDAGTPLEAFGDSLEAWLAVLPLYAELQIGETAHAEQHVEAGVPDLRVAALPERYERLLASDLPLDDDEAARLRAHAPLFAELVRRLAAHGVADSIQHDDLHHSNVFVRDGRVRVLDWGDSSVGHPFFSLVVTFRFLERVNRLEPGDGRLTRLRDAYLEPWGAGHEDAFDLAHRVGQVAHAIAWLRQREHLPLGAAEGFDALYPEILRRALAQLDAARGR